MASIYHVLDPAQREIRLLRLLPSESFEAQIRCKLIQTFLGGGVRYEAISYTWGKPEFTQAIELESQPFYITPNLESALRYLRRASEERVLWVDGICINQEDPVERSHQVTLMKDIYSHCEADLAWLGPSPSEAQPKLGEELGDVAARKRQEEGLKLMQEGMDLMKRIRDRDITTLSTMRENWERGPGRRNRAASKGGERWLLSWKEKPALSRLFGRPELWSRIWVMQELSCAPRVLLVAGTTTLDWDVIDSFLGDAPYADAFHLPWSHGTTQNIRRLFDRVRTIQHQRGIVRDMANGYKSTLLDVLARFKFASSTDPRDTIYGLLGLVSEDHTIKVDYTEPADKLFSDVTKFFIDSAANLDIICQNPWQINDWNSKTDGLPSWAADFTYRWRSWVFEDQYSSLLFAQRGIYAAGSQNCDVPCRVVGRNLLRLKGVIIGEIGQVVQNDYHETSDEAPEEYMRRFDWQLPGLWMQLYFGDKLLKDKLHTYPTTGEACLQAYWRTLVADCKAYPIERLSEEEIEADGKVFSEILRKTPTEENEHELSSLFKSLHSNSMRHRNNQHWTFTVSTNGLYLMLRRGARDGDVIAVLDGGKVPVVLRPVKRENGLRFVFINVAYVHGFMDGAAAQKSELKEQDFLIA